MSVLARLKNPGLRDVALYAFATGVAAVLTLLLTRVLWRALTPAEFGIWSLIDPLLLPAASLLLLGIDHSIVKQLRIDRAPLPVVVGALLASTVPVSLSGLLVIDVVLHLATHLAWTETLLLTMAGEALILMVQTAFRAVGAVRSFAIVLVGRNLLYLLLLLLVRGLGPVSIDLVFLLRGGCVIAISIAALIALRPRFKFRWAQYRDAIHYGFPLLLTNFIFAISDMTDRWFLADFSGVQEVGIYALQLKVAAILSQAIVIPFGMWFAPERFRRLEDLDGGRHFFIRTAVLLALVCGYLSGGVWLARYVVLGLIAPGAVISPLSLALCLGAVSFLALSQALNVGLLAPGQTGKNVVCMGVTIAVTVLASAILVPKFGINGAAASRFLGGLVMMVATAIWSNRVYPIAFPFAAGAAYAVASVLAAFWIDRWMSDQGLAAMLVTWTIVTGLFALSLWSRVVRAGPAASFLRSSTR